ncbi:L-arabinose isomerase [Cohaesibacter celericrescens]|uniref:L-arabinose isomerase n=2 Tax=Cohaesibacter celericrescens TaxID=2067669 RepID=A0A2N5XMA3_9HYPH|nr:L-arabinose isomerase [Cohaesibacter celericrescens]PLW75671.1 L-arabinose isomerase [Cohaesibacter celericrescens]
MYGLKPLKFWFVCGSQHLYGPEALAQVGEGAKTVAEGLAKDGRLVLPVEFAGVVTTSDDVTDVCRRASADPECGGLIIWMHTFSPAKMWIRGLTQLTKPLLHLHTQLNAALPWESIDMDYMNLHQAAHGDREAGFMHTRMRLRRKVVVGHWSDSDVQDRIDAWMRAARAWHDWQGARFCRFGDNMRDVAVTEGDKVATEMAFGFGVDGYGIGDLVDRMAAFTDAEVEERANSYSEEYVLVPELAPDGAQRAALLDAARQDLGIEAFLREGGYKGFSHNFQDLHGLNQLPGLAPQRMMAQGFGFAGEGDWKTPALLRAMKVMGHGLTGACSFMEDYTYDMTPGAEVVLGSHMLEICPTIADGKPQLEIHPLGIGDKADPVRMVFNARKGSAVNACFIDLGNRFRLIANTVTSIDHPDLPKLPVARAVWECNPDFKTACTAWILAGGAHHTAYSYDVTSEMLEDFANIAGMELALIDEETSLSSFKQDLRMNEVYWHLANGIKA